MLPADVSRFDAETYARLSKLSGAEFDKAYTNEIVKDHGKRRGGISEGSDKRQVSIA
jgi:predicted outer membrane protein